MFLCCICDEKHRVTRSKAAPGVCGICGGGCAKVRVLRVFRACFIPVWCSRDRRVMSARRGCRAVLRHY